jgi:hypothetical protein
LSRAFPAFVGLLKVASVGAKGAALALVAASSKLKAAISEVPAAAAVAVLSLLDGALCDPDSEPPNTSNSSPSPGATTAG